MSDVVKTLPGKPFLSLHHQVQNALRQLTNAKVSPFVMMAVAVEESYAVPWFCECDLLFKQNLRAMHGISGLTPTHFLGEIIVRSGPNKGKIPKFRMEPSWYEDYYQEAMGHKYSAYQAAMLCCSFGIGQKGARFLVDKIDWPERIEYLRAFNANPDMQLVQMAKDLHYLQSGAEGNLKLALTRYNAGGGADEVTRYGVRVASLAARFEKQYGVG